MHKEQRAQVEAACALLYDTNEHDQPSPDAYVSENGVVELI